MQEKKEQIKIEFSEDLKNTYSNVVFMNYNQSEIVVDFGRILPAIPVATVYSRVILTPQHTKRLMQLLDRNITKYEQKFGEISLKKG